MSTEIIIYSDDQLLGRKKIWARDYAENGVASDTIRIPGEYDHSSVAEFGVIIKCTDCRRRVYSSVEVKNVKVDDQYDDKEYPGHCTGACYVSDSDSESETSSEEEPSSPTSVLPDAPHCIIQ